MYPPGLPTPTFCGVVLGSTMLGSLARLNGSGGTTAATAGVSGFFFLPGFLNL